MPKVNVRSGEERGIKKGKEKNWVGGGGGVEEVQLWDPKNKSGRGGRNSGEAGTNLKKGYENNHSKEKAKKGGYVGGYTNNTSVIKEKNHL